MRLSCSLVVSLISLILLTLPAVSMSEEYCSPLSESPNTGSLMDISQTRGYGYNNASIQWLLCDGHQAFVIMPQNVKKTENVSPWVLDALAWEVVIHHLDAMNKKEKDECNKTAACKYPDNGQSTEHYWYISRLLDKGFYIVGIDVGTTYGAPRGAEAFQHFYTYLRSHYPLQEKARLIGQSNGGLIALAWAFRNPQAVDRIAAIYPAVDLTSWPGLQSIVEAGGGSDLGFGKVSLGELQRLLPEVNPIEHLQPLANKQVKLFFVHGTSDKTVNFDKNSLEAEKRYKTFGGTIILDRNSLDHGAHPLFYESQRLLDFLAQ